MSATTYIMTLPKVQYLPVKSQDNYIQVCPLLIALIHTSLIRSLHFKAHIDLSLGRQVSHLRYPKHRGEAFEFSK